MSADGEIYDRMRKLADAVYNGTISETEQAELDTLLDQNEELSSYYRQYMTGDTVPGAFPEPASDVKKKKSFEDWIRGKLVWFSVLVFVVSACLVFIELYMFLDEREEGRFQLSFDDVSRVRLPNGMIPTEAELEAFIWYDVTAETQVNFPQGRTLFFEFPGALIILGDHKIQVKGRSVKVGNGEADTELQLYYQNNVFISGDASYLLKKSAESVEVNVETGTVKAASQNWMPVYYWPMDYPLNEVVDVVNGERSKFSDESMYVEGLIGSGATDASLGTIDLGNGGGKRLGTGLFAAESGLTLEMLIKPDWKDYDFKEQHIFNKADRGKLSLSFTNWKYMTKPGDGHMSLDLDLGITIRTEDKATPAYVRLRVPLDGEDGRPAMDDLNGELLHIVATLNGYTGRASLYINGKEHAFQEVGVDSIIISGGQKHAVLSHGNLLRFTGIIDELAFYNVGLYERQVGEHYANVLAGKNYFGFDLREGDFITLKDKHEILSFGDTASFDLVTGMMDR